MPLLSTRLLITAAAVLAVVVLVVVLVVPVLRPDTTVRPSGPALGDPSRISTDPLPEAPEPSEPRRRAAPDPGRPAIPPSPQPRSVAEVVGSFPRGLAALRRRLGARAQLTSVTVNQISVLFAHRLGRSDRAGVLRWRPELGRLELASPLFAGTGSAADEAFPLASVRPAVPQRLIAQLRRAAPRGHVVGVLRLFRLPVSRRLIWQASVEAGGRQLTYRARPDGSGLALLR